MKHYYRFIQLVYIILLGLLLSGCPLNNRNTSASLSSDHSQYAWQHRIHNKTVWKALSRHFTIASNNRMQPAVQSEIRWFQHRQDYINELTRNARPYIYYIYQTAQKMHLPAELALLPMIESNFNPFAYSRTGATGLWQLMPGTASGCGLDINWWYDGRRSIIPSTKAALAHLEYLHHIFHNWLLAIAAYDSGEGTVKAAIAYNQRRGRPTNVWALPLPKETKMYVPKLLALAVIIENPQRYHLHLNRVPNLPLFSTVTIHHPLSLNIVAHLSQTNLKNVRLLNPGFRRNNTPPQGKFTLLLPTNKIALFQKQLAQLKDHQPIALAKWHNHTVKSGEALSVIASNNHISLQALKSINHLHANTIRVGEHLHIPQRPAKPNQWLKNNHLTRTSIAEDAIPGPKQITHKTGSHETLWSIAAHYDVSPADIRYWNNLSYHAKLRSGEQLIIWRRPKRIIPHYFAYRVSQGDSLGLIAARFGVSIQHIKSVNHLHNNTIRLGAQLHIPRFAYNNAHTQPKMIIHYVKSGESVCLIAKNYHVHPKELISWNHLQHQPYLHIGEPIRILLF